MWFEFSLISFDEWCLQNNTEHSFMRLNPKSWLWFTYISHFKRVVLIFIGSFSGDKAEKSIHIPGSQRNGTSVGCKKNGWGYCT